MDEGHEPRSLRSGLIHRLRGLTWVTLDPGKTANDLLDPFPE